MSDQNEFSEEKSRELPKKCEGDICDHEIKDKKQLADMSKCVDLPVGLDEFAEAWGDTPTQVASLITTDLAHMMPESFTKGDLDNILKLTLGLLKGIKPRDSVESMLAAQMICAHILSMKCYDSAFRAEYLESINVFANRAVRFSKAFSSGLEALEKYRGKSAQKIVVERVDVKDGGQAVVGVVEQGGIK